MAKPFFMENIEINTTNECLSISPNKEGVLISIEEDCMYFACAQLSIDQAEELCQYLRTILNHK